MPIFTDANTWLKVFSPPNPYSIDLANVNICILSIFIKFGEEMKYLVGFCHSYAAFTSQIDTHLPNGEVPTEWKLLRTANGLKVTATDVSKVILDFTASEETCQNINYPNFDEIWSRGTKFIKFWKEGSTVDPDYDTATDTFWNREYLIKRTSEQHTKLVDMSNRTNTILLDKDQTNHPC